MLVRVSETYDLSTVPDKMGLVSIHTPDLSLIKKMWGGLLQNYRYMRFAQCDVAMACASTLPADPLQIGQEAGDIAPQDMFNPILYRAVSNDSYNTLLNRIISLSNLQDIDTTVADVNKNSISSVNDLDIQAPTGADGALAAVDQFQLYYALLAEPDGWRKAMPQAGLNMSGLYPIVFSIVSNFGNTVPASKNSFGNFPYMGDTSNTSSLASVASFFRGPSMKMPRFPTAYIAGGNTEPVFGSEQDGRDVVPGVTGADSWTPPTAYVAAIVLPPAKLNRLYYRMKVTWTIELSEPRPLTEVVSWADLAKIGAQSYGTDYVEQSGTMSVKTSAVDANGANVSKIMEAGR